MLTNVASHHVVDCCAGAVVVLLDMVINTVLTHASTYCVTTPHADSPQQAAMYILEWLLFHTSHT